jgi:hypothetical protein
MADSCEDFIDIGNGWFFSFDPEWSTNSGDLPIGYVADSLSSEPDNHYGPAAWDGKEGPLSARLLLEVGTHPHEEEHGFVVRPTPFPGPVHVTEAGRAAGLGALHGTVVESLEVLLVHPGFKRDGKQVAVTTKAVRLAAVKAFHQGMAASPTRRN